MADITNRTSENGDEKNSKKNDKKNVTISRYDQFIAILEKIPLFKGLSIAEFSDILSVSTHRTFQEKEILFSEGNESYEMFILIKGQLQVVLPDGKVLARVNPPGIVGEMGVFTSENRSATVVTAGECICLVISKFGLMSLFSKNHTLGISILLNVICDLSGKLRKDNKIIEYLYQDRIDETGPTIKLKNK